VDRQPPLAPALSLALGLAALAVAPLASGLAPTAGAHYRVVDPPVATSVKPGQVEVIEFFSLGCPHCGEFEPALQAWRKRQPANVALVRLPATFNPFFKLMGRVYYALEDVGAAERLTPQLFDAIHVARDPALLRPLGEWQNRLQRHEDAAAAEAAALAALVDYAAARGVDATKLNAALRSPSVALRLARADATYRRYGVLGVPALSVAGKYFTTAGRPFANRSYGELLDTIDYLVALESKPRG